MRTDEDIKQDIIASLYWDVRVDAARIGVFVEDGHVRLTGSVTTYRSWAAAREDARVITGVRSVANHVEVEISAELDTPTDAQLRDALEEVLSSDPDLAATAVDVTVVDGHVTLSGTVPTFWERELAKVVTTTLPGVRGCTNELVVVPDPDRGDAEIARAIVDALRRNRHVDLTDLDVSVDGGEVTVGGPIADDTTREQVLDAARHTEGVTEIVDKLAVRDRPGS
ncbi:BON domain-containing protein [Salsipaludibacter albus]|uniref:BON domain-containing protein n=1 Tax=Salsipaludibacter albus TaxID=2849650 RepID=UPI001EE45B51|nr:BON domain-containing protein [Salsipaludibacter albus]